MAMIVGTEHDRGPLEIASQGRSAAKYFQRIYFQAVCISAGRLGAAFTTTAVLVGQHCSLEEIVQ